MKNATHAIVGVAQVALLVVAELIVTAVRQNTEIQIEIVDDIPSNDSVDTRSDAQRLQIS